MTQLQVPVRPAVQPREVSDGSYRPVPPACRGGFAATARLARELEALEALLRDAERTATVPRSSVGCSSSSTWDDMDSRLAELERRERTLQEWERVLGQHRALLLQGQERLSRSKESLKRAIARFRAEVRRQVAQLDARSTQLARGWSELLAARRVLARQQTQFKLAARAAAGARGRSYLKTG